MKYSVILPVRNGGEYVKECVQSVLNQTLLDFNLIVLDNCSTDGTSEWLQSLDDDRIKIYFSSIALTIEENWSRILAVPKNEFITLIGHDDILFPNYLSTMDRLISKHPNASLYQTHFRYIDSKGSLIRLCKPMDEMQSASEFVSFFLTSSIDTMGTGFMMRSNDYDKVQGIPPRYPNLLFADFELFINLTAIGYKATAPDECFAFRLHQSMTTTSSDMKFQKAYEIFIEYLHSLKRRDEHLDTVIQRYALQFIANYSKGLAHRLLRTPIKKREGRTVAGLLSANKRFADQLVAGNEFNPESKFSVRIAKRIDSSAFYRGLFRLYKKLYPAPIFK